MMLTALDLNQLCSPEGFDKSNRSIHPYLHIMTESRFSTDRHHQFRADLITALAASKVLCRFPAHDRFLSASLRCLLIAGMVYTLYSPKL